MTVMDHRLFLSIWRKTQYLKIKYILNTVYARVSTNLSLEFFTLNISEYLGTKIRINCLEEGICVIVGNGK
jgi:hypothetical protein